MPRTLESARPISSTTRASESISSPIPPWASGSAAVRKPRSASFPTIERSIASARSHSAAYGAISASQNARAVSRISCCSSESVKSIARSYGACFSCDAPAMVTVRRLGPGDEEVVAQLAERPPQAALLGDDAAIFLVAVDGGEPIGFVLAYELPRRHGDTSMLLVYEVDVDEAHRHRGVATSLLDELARLARERGIGEGFVLTDPENDAANALYRSQGAERRDVVEWDFRYDT